MHDPSIVLVAAVISNDQFDDDVNSTHDKFHWSPDDKVRIIARVIRSHDPTIVGLYSSCDQHWSRVGGGWNDGHFLSHLFH